MKSILYSLATVCAVSATFGQVVISQLCYTEVWYTACDKAGTWQTEPPQCPSMIWSDPYCPEAIAIWQTGGRNREQSSECCAWEVLVRGGIWNECGPSGIFKLSAARCFTPAAPWCEAW